MRTHLDWSRMPSGWIIQEQGLRDWTEFGDSVGTLTASLALYLAIIHHTDEDDHVARLSYDELQGLTGFSRSTISKALEILVFHNRIEKTPNKNGWYYVCGHDGTPWAKVPAKTLYTRKVLSFANALTLRNRAEFDALRIYLLIAAFRDNSSNRALLSYDKIEEYTNMPRNRISPALTVLSGLNLYNTDIVPSTRAPMATARAYRLAGLDGYEHSATTAQT